MTYLQRRVAAGALLAASAFIAALLAFRARRPELREDEIEGRLSSASISERDQDREAALDGYRESLEAARELDRPLLLSRAANRLAALEQKGGRLDEARSLAEEALAAAERAGSAAELAAALFNLGSVQYSRGHMREAIGFFEKSARKAASAQDLDAEARAELQLGVAATMMEQRERALAALDRAISLSRAQGDRRAEARAVRVLGELHSRLGETDAALEDYQRAREILRPVGDLVTEATLSNSVGQVYFDLDDKETALRYYQSALAINRRLAEPRRIAATSLEIGRCHLELGREREALPYLLSALDGFRALHNQRLEADVLTQLGRVYARLGDDDSARRSFEQALDLKIADSDPRERADTLREAAKFQASRGHPQKALSYLQEAFTLSESAHDPAGESLALARIALIQRDAGNLDQARKEIERSIGIIESLRAKVASHALRTSLFASVHDRYSFYVDVLMRLDRAHPGRGFDSLAFSAAERGRARTLLDALGEARASIREGIEPDLLQEERRLRTRLHEAANEQLLLPNDADSETASALENEIDSLQEEYDRLRATIRSRSPRYAALTQPRALTLPEVQTSLLDEDTRLLSYALGPERSFLWSVTRSDSRVYELPPRDEIERLSREVQHTLKGPGAYRGLGSGESSLERLSRILLAPVSDSDSDLRDRRRLVIVTEGALGFVPFGALLVSGRDAPGPTPLAAVSESVRLPSISVLPEIRARSTGRNFTRWAAVAADPVYARTDSRLEIPFRSGDSDGPARDLAFRKRLRSSGKEALAIAQAAPPGSVELVTGFEATRRWVTSSDFEGFRVIHFATHGVLDDGRPDLSGIVLSLVDAKGENLDGFLRLDDVYNLSLPVDLVVLSACETALGKQVRGEGLLSLVRGFMYAGARSVIASSWKVDDRATAELMGRFYRGLFAGKAPSAALREAELSMYQTKRFRDPYYWAGFELQGDWKWYPYQGSPGPGPLPRPR